MSDTFKQQAEWLKTWQESQEKLVKQYVGWGEEWVAKMAANNYKVPDFFKGWLNSQGDLDGQFRELGNRLNEIANNVWGGKVPPEMMKYMNLSFFEEFYKNWLSSIELPEGTQKIPGMDGGWQQLTDFLHAFMEKNNPFFSTFNNLKTSDSMNRVFGMLLGALGQEEGVFSDILNSYLEFFSKMFDSTTAQSAEKAAEVFDTWVKETEKHLSAPKLGINRELAHEISQLLVLSQNYIQTFTKMARLVEATSRNAGIRFQTKLSELALEKKPVNTFVDLCALWSVENESVFTEVMGSQEFAKIQGDFLDAGHRLKIQWNKLAEKALEPTPIALKRDLDLAIAEITQLKREIRALQRELRHNGKETQAIREAQAKVEEEAKKTKIAIKAVEAATAKVETEKTKAAGAKVGELPKRAKSGNQTVKTAAGSTTKAKAGRV